MKKLFIQLCAVALPVFSLTATATPQSIMQKIADTGKLANWQETSGNAGIPAALCLKSARNATLKQQATLPKAPPFTDGCRITKPGIKTKAATMASTHSLPPPTQVSAKC